MADLARSYKPLGRDAGTMLTLSPLPCRRSKRELGQMPPRQPLGAEAREDLAAIIKHHFTLKVADRPAVLCPELQSRDRWARQKAQQHLSCCGRVCRPHKRQAPQPSEKSLKTTLITYLPKLRTAPFHFMTPLGTPTPRTRQVSHSLKAGETACLLTSRRPRPTRTGSIYGSQANTKLPPSRW